MLRLDSQILVRGVRSHFSIFRQYMTDNPNLHRDEPGANHTVFSRLFRTQTTIFLSVTRAKTSSDQLRGKSTLSLLASGSALQIPFPNRWAEAPELPPFSFIRVSMGMVG